MEEQGRRGAGRGGAGGVPGEGREEVQRRAEEEGGGKGRGSGERVAGDGIEEGGGKGGT